MLSILNERDDKELELWENDEKKDPTNQWNKTHDLKPVYVL